ncbi:hypothetical protein [Streptomyces sp. RKAG293]|uniref:hypothetical protein n=1 Tax=Streptomyces sp. RKAG293 TaxID=2893403 RepID=UPI0020343997|nr:hypothetical protein [Streptomyces sp. RKAG293]MCM2416562.1 hypothetical protein [Streptomyces sp. RKAG293]
MLAKMLEASEAAPPVESLDVVARILKERLGAASVSFLITDFTGSSVVRLGAAESVETTEPARPIGLRNTVYDGVIRSQQPSVQDLGPGELMRVIAPVTNCGDAIGLRELFLPAVPDTEVMREIGETAHALAYIVVANRFFTDLYQWGRRSFPLSLAAEIQHRLLPGSLACEAAQFAVAQALEPADYVGATRSTAVPLFNAASPPPASRVRTSRSTRIRQRRTSPPTRNVVQCPDICPSSRTLRTVADT